MNYFVTGVEEGEEDGGKDGEMISRNLESFILILIIFIHYKNAAVLLICKIQDGRLYTNMDRFCWFLEIRVAIDNIKIALHGPLHPLMMPYMGYANFASVWLCKIAVGTLKCPKEVISDLKYLYGVLLNELIVYRSILAWTTCSMFVLERYKFVSVVLTSKQAAC